MTPDTPVPRRGPVPPEGVGCSADTDAATAASEGASPGERGSRPAPGRRARGSLETEIIDVLNQCEAALSPAQVRAKLPGSTRLSYSTVVTILTRLHAKGLVTRHRDGRSYRYAAGDPASVAALRMTRLLDDQADHRTALTHFLAALSPGDEALLRALISESGTAAHDGPADGPEGGAVDEAGADSAIGRARKPPRV